MLEFMKPAASLAMEHKPFCAIALVLVCFGPVYSAFSALVYIAYRILDHLHWTNIFWRHLPDAAWYILPKRLHNYFWPPMRDVPGWIVYDPKTGRYVLVVLEEEPQNARRNARRRTETYHEEELVFCTRCKRENPGQWRMPTFCQRCKACYCNAKCRKADARVHRRRCPA
ncbi:hypothetical protein HDZ31DRAFT_67122 [Schizophyllum fasciatum]